MDWLSQPEAWVAFLTLLALEIVLGIDNIIFISILAGKLPVAQQNKARLLGLGLAMFMRIALLFSLAWIVSLTAPLFSIPFLEPLFGGAKEAAAHATTSGHDTVKGLPWEISGRDIILLLGGLFLIAKSTHEIHQKLEGEEGHTSKRVAPSFASVIVQILLLDIVFSLDSVITAVGMVDNINIMISAVVVAIAFMMFFAKSISDFVDKRPTVKMLALSFLLLIGVTLLAEGFDQHISKGYIYFAMAFSVFVEMLNLKLRGSNPVKLHEAVVANGEMASPEADKPANLV
jgi:predicted tellurium resistance membrane protein TerC